MKKALLLLIIAISCGMHSFAQIPLNIQAELEDTLQDIGSQYDFHGLSVAVQNPSGTWSSSYGTSHLSIPLDTNMLIGIGSSTKTFVSVCLMQLVESGQITLSDTIGTYVSNYANINGAVTIKQVLNHTSGIASYTDNQMFWDTLNSNVLKLWTKEEILQNYVGAPSFTPGTSWEYSNTNYLIAGKILETILNKPVYQIIRDSILTPLNLQETFFPPFETATQTYAHFWTDVNGDNILDEACDWNTPGASVLPIELNTSAEAAGAMVSTAADMTRFWKGLMTEQLISKSTLVNSMLQWTSLGGSMAYGMGIFRDNYFSNTVFMHGGTWVGQIHSDLADSSRGIYISVLSNQDSLANSFTEKVVKALYKIMLTTYPTAVSNASTSDDMIVFPNPARDVLSLKTDWEISTIQVYDMFGKLVLSTTQKQDANISSLAPASYLIKVVGDKGAWVGRFVKSSE